jgi:hypothetical protein
MGFEVDFNDRSADAIEGGLGAAICGGHPVDSPLTAGRLGPLRFVLRAFVDFLSVHPFPVVFNSS